MGLFDKIKELVFLKRKAAQRPSCSLYRSLLKPLPDHWLLDLEIKCLEAGIYGENAIIYELRKPYSYVRASRSGRYKRKSITKTRSSETIKMQGVLFSGTKML